MNKHPKSRNYIFTINNYNKKILKRFVKVAESLERHKYICFGLEIAPTTGTKHIQGYIQLDDNQAFTFLYNYFDLKKENGEKIKFHVQVAKGSLEDNKKYTSKGPQWYEFGEPKKLGRSDLSNIKTLIAENPQDLEKIVQEKADNYQQVKYAESIQKYFLKARNPDTPPKVFWIYGSTGSGKTKLVFDSFESICFVSDLKWPGDGYIQQECLLIDDYRTEDMSFQTLLKITDRYPLKLAFKGGSVQLNSAYIVITSPESIQETFRFLREDLNQLKRRLIAEIDMDNEKVEDLKKYQRLQDF